MELKIDHVCRIEGHADVHIEAEGNTIKEARFMPNEGRRFFEGLLKGRYFYDAPIITSRICGVCSEAHLLASLEAMEKALGVQSSEQTKLLRKIMLIASIIESHALHIYALALPDYLGYESVLSMAATPEYGKVVKEALRIKKLSNTVLDIIGGRSTHPVTFVVGGLTNLPTQKNIEVILKKLKEEALPFAKFTYDLLDGLQYPEYNAEHHEYIAVFNPKEYGVQGEELISSKGGKINIDKDAASYFIEYEHPYHSNKVTKTPRSETIVCDALARVNLNYQFLTDKTKELIANSKHAKSFPTHNPFLNNLAQAIELYHFCDYTINVLENVKIKEEPRIKVEPKAGRGICMQEVPRGTIMHEYSVDSQGKIENARVMAPTTFFTGAMDDDLKHYAQNLLNQGISEPEFIKNIEMLVRSYDPCISCATHKMKIRFIQK